LNLFPQDPKEMSFVDHLEELRWNIIRSVIAILVFSIAAFASMNLIFHHIILAPARPDFWTYRMLCKLVTYAGQPQLCIDKINFTLQSRSLSGQFSMHLTSAFVVGMVLAFPYVFWEIWRFIKPGLHLKEQKTSTGAVFFVSLLFMMGILFGYYIVSPLSIQFLANYQLSEQIENQFDVASYISTLTTLTFSCGLMFQLPMIMFVLTKIGIVTPDFLRNFRRHAIVVILIIAAIITPPDVMSQILVSLPLFILYEVSIWVSAWELRRIKKRLLVKNN
jgi:sec-independent protein translocase protein TatC